MAEIEMPEHPAGLFTSPVWLLRHQTNRGRANRIYGGFYVRNLFR